MILIGTMNLTRTLERGDFYCPQCTAMRPYRLRSRRPFLTLYFIPVVPVGAAEEIVVCDTCRNNWPPNVLELDEAAYQRMQAEQFREEALRTALLVVVADGTISEEEINTLVRVGDQLLEVEVDRESVGQMCASAQHLNITPLNYLRAVSIKWTLEQRIVALQAAFLAASAEGELGAPQLELLAGMRDLFDLTDTEYQEAIEQAIELASS